MLGSRIGRIEKDAIESLISALLSRGQFLETANQSRFRFKRTGDRLPSADVGSPTEQGAFRVSTEVWAIAYDEK